MLQQQLNVAKNVVKRLQKSLSPVPQKRETSDPLELLPEICSDKVHLLSEFLIESLLGISFMTPSSALLTVCLDINGRQFLCNAEISFHCVVLLFSSNLLQHYAR